ncbi:glutathione S-transferase family protein [Qipengyuania spongiae]|uniref:Glutathione S-transferase family protein n=1 Tax=Qipengyuania spongiae TaxID=2909673 RepID=A0ABY5T0B8_9SPHN|nr:glutathione S-transferase family protein [Qipengyuania spongiae]UVI39551.1 glutathione S-transferase family protein [Qipengyuania spongiae]
MSLVLYGHPFSSYTWKALIPLYANVTEFEFREVDPSQPGGSENIAFVQFAHPAGKFPVLVDGDAVIIEATAIVEYLAVHHPSPAKLIPDHPATAVDLRMLDRVFDNYVMGSAQLVVNAFIADRDNPDPAQVEAGKTGLLRAYRWIEERFDDLPLRPHVTLVTCAAAPALFYGDWIERIPDHCPNLAAYRAEILALPAVARCVDGARAYRDYFPLGAPDRD